MRSKDENKRLRIKQACIDLAFDDGIEGISAIKLAKKAKVSAASIYVYYDNMSDMLQKINEEILVDYFNEISEVIDLDRSVKQNFLTLWNAAYNYCKNHYKEFIFTTRISNTCVVDLKRKNAIPPHHKRLFEYLDKAINEHKVKPLSVECFIYIAFTPFYGILKTNIENDVVNIDDDIHNLLITAAWDAVRI
ncbi:hypothetical protein [Flagellimonas lutimaris]|uniref:hypothetical protein n=1 Tax=Flagellimonas lutimaris TaxID=475082 RepID=UPI003F5CBD67